MAEDDPHRQYYKRKNSKAFAFRLTMEFATPVDGYDTVERGWMGGDEEFGQFGHLWFVMTGHNPPLPNVTPEREDMQRAWELFAGRYQRVTGQANWMVRSTDFIDTVWGGAFLDPGEPAADAIVSEWAPLSLRKPVGAS